MVCHRSIGIQMAVWMVLFGLIVELILRTHYLAQQETQYEIIALKHLSNHPDLNLAGQYTQKRSRVSLQNRFISQMTKYLISNTGYFRD